MKLKKNKKKNLKAGKSAKWRELQAPKVVCEFGGRRGGKRQCYSFPLVWFGFSIMSAGWLEVV